jgi:hypothetical protein
VGRVNGFIGSHLAAAAVARAFRVVGSTSSSACHRVATPGMAQARSVVRARVSAPAATIGRLSLRSPMVSPRAVEPYAPHATLVLQSGSVHQVVEFLSFTVGLVATVLKSFYESLAGLLPASVWVAAAALVFALVLYSRLSSRVEEVEMALLQLDAKLDTILSRLGRPRDHAAQRDADDKSRS